MKIRADFVTNSSSSSFTEIHIKSKKIADYLKERMNEINGFFEVNIQDSVIDINAGDRDCIFFEVPPELCDAIEYLFEVIGVHFENNKYELTQSIEEMTWHSETWGLDGNDGSYERKNYDPDVLQELLEDIACMNECTAEDVTDEMFLKWVAIDPDTVTQEGTFEYSKKTGKSRYYYTNRMRVDSWETDEKKFQS